jgi:hypothetical protein
MLAAELHAAVRPISFLIGTWQGEGAGEYPTIQPFNYGEEVRFWHVGKPFLLYTQRTWSTDDRRPLHAEAGYLRAVGGDRLEFVVAQAIGLTEIEEGHVRDNLIELSSSSLARTPTAKPVTGVKRKVRVNDDLLEYELSMSMASVPLTHHLSAALRRQA